MVRASIAIPLAILVAVAVAVGVVQGVLGLLGFLFVAAIGFGFLVWIVGWRELVRALRRR